MQIEFEIQVDRGRPPQLGFTDTDGRPILAYHAEPDGDAPLGWVLYVEHYQPFPTGVHEFDRVFDALAKAQAHLSENAYFLDATVEADGSLTLSGQNLGPSIGDDGEYEYWYTVAAEDVPALVIALGGEPGEDIIELLERRWSGDAVSGLGQVLRTSGVEYEFSSRY